MRRATRKMEYMGPGGHVYDRYGGPGASASRWRNVDPDDEVIFGATLIERERWIGLPYW